MTSEPHQNIGGGGSMISEPHQILGGSMKFEPHQNIFFFWGGGGGAQWYLSPIKNIGGGGSMISEPHQNIGEAQWYPSPTNILGGGGAQWYPRSTQNIGGGGAQWYLGPTKILGGGGSMISEPYQNIFWASMICEIRCLSPPPLPKQVFIKCLYLNGKSVDYRYTWVSCLEYNDWGGGGLMISEPRNKYWGRLNDIWAPLKILGAQWYLSP